MLLSSLSLTLLAAASSVSALPAITRKGRYLYDESGTRFLIKGVAYQEAGQVADQTEANAANGGFPEPSSYVDPLADGAACKRDLPYLQQLGVNTVRVYSVNSSLNHDECMKAFEDAKIYTIIDLALPLNGSINRADPAWQTNLLDLYTTTVTSFNKYTNVLAYNIGNEVVTLSTNTPAAPFIKAAARDIKAFLRSTGSTALVGYTSTDGPTNWRNPLSTYLSCSSEEESIDLYGLNNYEFCGNVTYQTSGWQGTTEDYEDLTIPAYFSEYGCNTVTPRTWSEVSALYSTPASDTWSGGIAFSYFPTSDNYGMITLSSDNSTVTTSQDFTNLASALSNVTLPTTPAQSSVSNAAAPACPAQSSAFNASSTLPPTPNESVCQCLMENAFGCVREETTAQEPLVVGSLIDYTCSLLGQAGGGANCDNIGANGGTGVYGTLSYCAPDVKLSYAFSAYYVSQGYDSQACDFSGNATTNANVPKNADSASSAAASCLAAVPSGGTFTPSAVAPSTASATGSSTSSGSNASQSSGGSSTSSNMSGGEKRASGGWVGVGIASFAVVLGGALAI